MSLVRFKLHILLDSPCSRKCFLGVEGQNWLPSSMHPIDPVFLPSLYKEKGYNPSVLIYKRC